MATSMATARTETAVRVLRCITFAAARFAMGEQTIVSARKAVKNPALDGRAFLLSSAPDLRRSGDEGCPSR
jgi:Na+-transporting NADH:ubiquinone oxidoreductase subunit NqrB